MKVADGESWMGLAVIMPLVTLIRVPKQSFRFPLDLFLLRI